MIKNIVNTFFFRSLNAILSLAIVIFTARYLGAEIRGEISLFVLNVTLVFQLISIVSGGGLVYYASKKPISSLIFSSVIWSIIASVLGSALLFFTGFVTESHFDLLIIATLLLAWFYIGMNLIVGFEWIKTFNLISSLQLIIMTSLLLVFIHYQYFDLFNKWYYAYIISFVVGILILKIIIIRQFDWKKFSFHFSDLSLLFHYGKWSQLANIAQLLNYRLGYYLLEYFAGKQALGIYSSAVAIAEGVWLISKSFSMVVFSRISNMKSQDEAIGLTFQFARISFYLSLGFIAVLLVIPSDMYTYVFGEEFYEIKPLLFLLSPGIAFFALSTVYAHYFSGTGRPKISSFSSLLGLIATIVFGFWLIPMYEKIGVAITASLSFLLSTIYLLISIMREPGASISRLLPQKSDVSKLMEFLKIK